MYPLAPPPLKIGFSELFHLLEIISKIRFHLSMAPVCGPDEWSVAGERRATVDIHSRALDDAEKSKCQAKSLIIQNPHPTPKDGLSRMAQMDQNGPNGPKWPKCTRRVLHCPKLPKLDDAEQSQCQASSSINQNPVSTTKPTCGRPLYDRSQQHRGVESSRLAHTS